MAVQKRNDELADLLGADFVRSRMPFVAHNGVGGFWDGAFNVADNTAITLLGSSNPYRVTGWLRYSVVAVPNVGVGIYNASEAGLGDTVELFNDGDTVVELTVNVAGAVDVQRTAGTETVKLKLRLDWI